jgi:hypothetical protein
LTDSHHPNSISASEESENEWAGDAGKDERREDKFATNCERMANADVNKRNGLTHEKVGDYESASSCDRGGAEEEEACFAE